MEPPDHFLRECSFNIGGRGMGRNCDKFRIFSQTPLLEREIYIDPLM